MGGGVAESGCRYSYFIPISLFVTLEIVKFGQARFMEWDHRMSTSTQEMRAKTSNLNDELALIDYVFTDKTGTLTQNIMRFSSCSVGGLEHNELVNPGGLEHALQGNHVTRAQAASIREFLLSMALCHEVVPEVDEESGSELQTFLCFFGGGLEKTVRMFVFVLVRL